MIRKTIRLPQAQAESIEAAISSGAYRNQSAVIRAALRLWQREQEQKRAGVGTAIMAASQGRLTSQRISKA